MTDYILGEELRYFLLFVLLFIIMNSVYVIHIYFIHRKYIYDIYAYLYLIICSHIFTYVYVSHTYIYMKGH